MARWRSWEERRREIQQELAFANTGIGDLVNVCDAEDEGDLPRCAECGSIWPDDQPRCAGCVFPEPIDPDD
jgi:hypothetical protein